MPVIALPLLAFALLAFTLLAFPGAARADLPADVAVAVRAMGAVNDAAATADVVRPMHALRAPPRDVVARRDISFGDHPLQRLDVFTSSPDMGAGKPILVFVHGGGFVQGDKHRPGDFTYDNVMIWAVSNGFVGVNTNYRLAPEFAYPNATQDVAAALAWAREHGAEYGGDPETIFLWGHSAGASLVGSYLGHPEFHFVQGSGVSGAVLASGSGYEIEETNAYFADESKLDEMASLSGLLMSDVPLFVMRAELDPPQIAQSSDRLNEALCNAGKCPAVFLQNPNHNHMTQVYTVNTSETDISERILAFLRENVN
jgi:triacylglycerol lipase